MTVFLSYLPDLLNGLSITIVLMLASLALGLILAVLMTLSEVFDYFILRKCVAAFIFFIRGTPLLVQLFLIYYGLGQFEWIRTSFAWVLLREPMACAIIALSLNTACYTAILFQGALRSVPQSEVDACAALGMSKWLAFRRVLFPRAFRLALPAYSNEVIIVLKCTSLASTITLLDLMGMIQKLINETYETVTFYLIAGVIYLLLNTVVIGVFKFIDRRTGVMASHE